MEYKLGCLPNPRDLRDIQIAQVQAPVEIPKTHITDIKMIPVLNQGNIGSCVGHAHATVLVYNELKENKKVIDLSPRYLYALSKRIDGYNGEGTFPRVTAKIMSDKGCPELKYLPNDISLSHADYIKIEETNTMTMSARDYKTQGYATVAPNKEALKQAIFQNGVVAVTIAVGGYTNPFKKGNIGQHRVVLFGYGGDTFFFRNSWGEQWGNKGDGWFDYDDQTIIDALVFTDLPNEIKEEARAKYKYFSEKEVVGLKPELVKMLDKARELAGIPFVITSGYRTLEHNAEVGGVEGSTHTFGEGCDLRARNSEEHFKITKALMDVGFKRISRKYPNHIHCDISKNYPSLVLF